MPYQKLQCVYCGYANGVLTFCSELGVRLERYWCGIQHERVEGFIAPPHHADFLEFGDEEALRQRIRKRWGAARPPAHCGPTPGGGSASSQFELAQVQTW